MTSSDQSFDIFDIFDKSKIEHVVSFIENKRFDIVENNFGEPDNLYKEEGIKDYSDKKDALITKLQEIKKAVEVMIRKKEDSLSEIDKIQTDQDIKQSKAFKYIQRAYNNLPSQYTKVI